MGQFWVSFELVLGSLLRNYEGTYVGRADDSSFDSTVRPEGLLGDDATQIDKLDENGEVVPVDNGPMGTMDEDQNGSGLVSQK